MADWSEQESSPNLAATLLPNDETNYNDSDILVNQDRPDIVKMYNCSLPTPFFKNVCEEYSANPDFYCTNSMYNIVTATICMLYLFFGIFCTFFGYRCFKATMFLTGFVFGSLVVYLICLEEEVLPMWANTTIAISAGILFGLITLLVQYVGLFMLGFHGGLILGLIILCSIELVRPESSPDSPWISIGVLLISGLVMALCNLYFQRVLTIYNSALYGAAVITTALDYFVVVCQGGATSVRCEHSVMLRWVWDRVRVKDSEVICWFSWAFASVWPLTFVIGILIQAWLTKNGIYHEEQFPSVKRRPKRESREERKQRKYRYLYQVRTCHGDVISQPIANKYVTQIDESHA